MTACSQYIYLKRSEMKNDKFAEGTWVVINELDDGNWGEGGSVLYADDA